MELLSLDMAQPTDRTTRTTPSIKLAQKSKASLTGSSRKPRPDNPPWYMRETDSKPRTCRHSWLI